MPASRLLIFILCYFASIISIVTNTLKVVALMISLTFLFSPQISDVLFRLVAPEPSMGGCVGTHSGGRRNSGSASGLSDSSLAPVTKNKPLKPDKMRWKSDIPLTDGQLMSKRDEFWDTAPAFEGRMSFESTNEVKLMSEYF